MTIHEKIDYIELPARDISANKKFFELAFGWQFQDFGEEYTAFADPASTNLIKNQWHQMAVHWWFF